MLLIYPATFFRWQHFMKGELDLSTNDGRTAQDGAASQVEPPSPEDPGLEQFAKLNSMLLSCRRTRSFPLI
jgi:hypothetical protein